MHLVQGILAALLARARTGVGQKVSVSLYDSMIAMQMQEAAQWSMHREVLNWAAMPLTGVFDTTDGAVVLVGAFKANPLRDICAALGIEDMSAEYPDLATQRKHKPFLQELFRDNFATNTTRTGSTGSRRRICSARRSARSAMRWTTRRRRSTACSWSSITR